MKATRKVLSVLLTLAMVLTFFCGLTTTAYAEEATGVRLEAERDGDTMKLNVVLNEELNFGGMSFVGYPTCDVEGVFTFEDMTTSVSGFSVEKGTWPSVTTGQNITLPKDTVFVTFTYSIDTTKFEEGKVYTFTCQLDQACHFDVEDLYDWGEDTLTTTYKEDETPVDPPAPTTIDLTEFKIKKTVVGTEFDPITFTFVVEPQGNAPAMFTDNKVTTPEISPVEAGTQDVEVALANPTFTATGTYTYTITEQNDQVKDWTYATDTYTLEVFVQKTGENTFAPTSVIVKDATGAKVDQPTFTNTYAVTTTTLTIKNVNVSPVAADKEFSYSITFTGPTKAPSGVTDPDGNALPFGTAYPFALVNDGTATFTNIPVGTTFTLTETGVKNHTHTGSGDINETGDDATVNGPDNLVLTGSLAEAKENGYNVEVKNEFTPEVTNLVVSKVVEGDPAYDETFSFTITFTAPEDCESVVIKAGNDELTYGTAYPFTLADGDSITFTNIPVEATYVLVETATENYTPSYSVNSGDTTEGTYGADLTVNGTIVAGDTDNTVVVTNTYSLTPPTGVTIHTEMILILALVLVAMIGSVVLTKKLRRA